MVWKFFQISTQQRNLHQQRGGWCCVFVTRKTPKKNVSQKLVTICPKMPFCVFVTKNSAKRVEPVISTPGWGLWQGRFAFVKCQGDNVYLVWSPRQAWVGQARVTAEIEVGSWFCLICFFVEQKDMKKIDVNDNKEREPTFFLGSCLSRLCWPHVLKILSRPGIGSLPRILLARISWLGGSRWSGIG